MSLNILMSFIITFILFITPILPIQYSRDQLFSIRAGSTLLSQQQCTLITSFGLRRRGRRAGLHWRRRVLAARGVTSSVRVSTGVPGEPPGLFINNDQLIVEQCLVKHNVRTPSPTTINTTHVTDSLRPQYSPTNIQPTVSSPPGLFSSSSHVMTSPLTSTSSCPVLASGLSPKLSAVNGRQEMTLTGSQSPSISLFERPGASSDGVQQVSTQIADTTYNDCFFAINITCIITLVFLQCDK